jgi:hypothetical protein
MSDLTLIEWSLAVADVWSQIVCLSLALNAFEHCFLEKEAKP